MSVSTVPRVPRAHQLERQLRSLGASSLPDAELLQLATGVPLARARALLEAHGGLTALSTRHPLELDAAAAAGHASAIAAAFELGRRVVAAAADPGWSVRSPADVAERLVPAMRHLEREELRVLLLSTKNVVTGMETVYAGNLAGSSVRVGEVFRDAVRRQAAAIVVVHNHPSGDPTPSGEDRRITAELAQAGRLLDIELVDHVVVGAAGWVSLRAQGGV